jgi:hypothetical protein
MAYERLSGKRKRFVDAYIGKANCNKSEAARLAGYAHPGQEGHRLYQHPEVRAAIEERMRAFALPAEEILLRLAEHARGDMAEFVDVYEGGGFRIDLSAAEKSGKLRLVKKVGYDQRGRPCIELYDAQSALLALAKRHGLFPERQELSGPQGQAIAVDHTVGVDEEDVERVGTILGILAECGALAPGAGAAGPAPADEVHPAPADGEAGGVPAADAA